MMACLRHVSFSRPMPKLTLLTHQSANGASWVFDPISQKWSVTLGGRTSSSQNFDTLTAKVKKWEDAVAEAARAKPAVKPSPAAPQVFSFGMARALDYRPSTSPEYLLTMAIPPRDKDGVTVKTAWDAGNERFDVVRYRLWSSRSTRETFNWESSQGNSQHLINFDALDADDQAWWRELFEHRARTAIAVKARETINQAWTALKSDTSAIFETTSIRQRENNGPLLQALPRAKVFSSSHVWMTLEGCPVAHVAHMSNPEGWSSEDGALVRTAESGTLRVRFSVDNPVLPTFSLTHEAPDGTVLPLWKGSSFELAVALGNASMTTLGPDHRGVAGWLVELGHGQELKDLPQHVFGLGRFPQHVEERTAVFHEGSGLRSAELMVLGLSRSRSSLNPFVDDDPYVSPSSDESSLGWHARRKANLGTVFLAKGPEDALLDVMADVDALVRQSIGPFVTSLGRGSAIEQRLSRQTQATLKHAYDLAGDGETLSEDPTHMVNRWQDTVVRLEARAAKHPSVVAFQQQCDTLVERATLLLIALGHTNVLNAKASIKGPDAR